MPIDLNQYQGRYVEIMCDSQKIIGKLCVNGQVILKKACVGTGKGILRLDIPTYIEVYVYGHDQYDVGYDFVTFYLEESLQINERSINTIKDVTEEIFQYLLYIKAKKSLPIGLEELSELRERKNDLENRLVKSKVTLKGYSKKLEELPQLFLKLQKSARELKKFWKSGRAELAKWLNDWKVYIETYIWGQSPSPVYNFGDLEYFFEHLSIHDLKEGIEKREKELEDEIEELEKEISSIQKQKEKMEQLEKDIELVKRN